jgi:undecaprenyl-diphosphatase
MQKAAENKTTISKLIQRVSLTMAFLIIVFIGCLVVLFLLADMIFEDKNFSFDDEVFTAIHPYINAMNTNIMEGITFLGSVAFLLPANILLILFFLFIKKDKHNAWKVVAVTITNTIVLFLLKSTLQRQRPLVPLISKAHGYSFPSGHSFSSVVFFGMLAYIAYRKINNKLLKWMVISALVMLIFMIGFSRIYLRLHFASDVIAGFSLGVIWLLLAKWILLKTSEIKQL